MACVKVELSNQNRKAGATLFAMNKITQDMRFQQAVIEYSLKHGVTKAAIRYKTTVRYNPLLTALTGLTAIQTSIQRLRSSSSRICAAGTLTPVWWSSG